MKKTLLTLICLFFFIEQVSSINLLNIKAVGGNYALELFFDVPVFSQFEYNDVEIMAKIDDASTRFRVVYAYVTPDMPNRLVLSLQRRLMNWHDWGNAKMVADATFSYTGNSIKDMCGTSLLPINSRKINLIDIVGTDSHIHNGTNDANLYVEAVPFYSDFEKELWANNYFGQGIDKVLHVDQKNSLASDSNNGDEYSPFKTISAAIQLLQPGTKIIIHPGIYRESVMINKQGTKEKPIIIEGSEAYGVIISGAKDWSTDWIYQEGGISTHNWPRSYALGGFGNLRGLGNNRENLFVNGEKYNQVATLSEVKEKCYFIGTNRKIHVRYPNKFVPTDNLIEVTDRFTPLSVLNTKYLIMRNLHFTKGADSNVMNGDNFLMEDCSITWQNFHGLTLKGNRFVIRRCTFDNNGGSGIDFTHSGIINGDNSFVNYNTVIEQCNINGNNWRIGGYGGQHGEYVGGIKACTLLNGIFRGLLMSKNQAPALWLDIHHSNILIENSHFVDGLQAVWIEICYGTTLIRNNTFLNNSSGVELSHSGYVNIEGNLFVNNKYQVGYGWQGGNGDSRDCCFKTIFPRVSHNIMIGDIINNFSQDYISFRSTCAFSDNFYESTVASPFSTRDFIGWKNFISPISSIFLPQELNSLRSNSAYSFDKWDNFHIDSNSPLSKKGRWAFISFDASSAFKPLLSCSREDVELHYTLNGYIPSPNDPIYQREEISMEEKQSLFVRAFKKNHSDDNPLYSPLMVYRTQSIPSEITENSLKTSLFCIYPNPAIDFLNVIFNKEMTEGLLSISTLQGKIIKRMNINATKSFSIPINLCPGTYLVVFQCDNEIFSERFVVVNK